MTPKARTPVMRAGIAASRRSSDWRWRSPAAGPHRAVTTAGNTPTTQRRWPARRPRSRRCTARPTSCCPAARTPTKGGSRRCAATRRWSTSGPPGAGPAASSSPTSSRPRRTTASGSPSSASTARTPTTPRAPSSKRRRSPTPATPTPDKDIGEAIGASLGLPDTAFYDRRGKLVYLKQGPYDDEAELRADIERYALGGDAESG